MKETLLCVVLLRQRWKTVVAVLAAIAILIWAFHFGAHHPRIRFSGLGWIHALSFAELEKAEPFVATVESKKFATWRATVGSTSREPNSKTKETPYVMIYLRRSNGKRLGVYQENPSQDEISFTLSLKVGETYRFPYVLKAVEAENKKLRTNSETNP